MPDFWSGISTLGKWAFSDLYLSWFSDWNENALWVPRNSGILPYRARVPLSFSLRAILAFKLGIELTAFCGFISASQRFGASLGLQSGDNYIDGV